MISCNNFNSKYQKLFRVGTSPSDKDLQNQFSDCGKFSYADVNLSKCGRPLMWWGNMSGFTTAMNVDGVSLILFQSFFLEITKGNYK